MRFGSAPLAGLLGLLLVAACSSKPDGSYGQTSAAVGGFPGCSGTFTTHPSPSGQYYATDFGCSSNPYFTDPGDTCGSAACIQSAYDEGVCTSSQSNATCQRQVNWYAVGGASYGCGARLEVTNPKNHKSVVVMVLDNGPSCTVENDADFWVLDVSYPTIQYLFGSEEGWADHALINAQVVAKSTPLGPVTGAPPPPADAGSGGSDGGANQDAGGGTTGGCTLGGHTYGLNACTETEQCNGSAWVERTTDPSSCAKGIEPGGACVTDSGAVVPQNTCTSSLQCDDGVWVDRFDDPSACL